MKPSTSVLVDRSVVAVEPQRIGGADLLGAVVGLRQRAGGLLVRDRHVGADIAALGQVVDEFLELLRRHRLAPVFGVEPYCLIQ